MSLKRRAQLQSHRIREKTESIQDITLPGPIWTHQYRDRMEVQNGAWDALVVHQTDFQDTASTHAGPSSHKGKLS